MCGRYVLYTEKEAMEINEIIREVERKMGVENGVKTGEICPTDLAPVLIDASKNIEPTAMKWGFPNYNSKGVIINARAETVNEKPSFSQAMLLRRCVVPASGFFEWTHVQDKKQKEKYLFQMPQASILYMAGLYNTYKIDGVNTPRFVILTTQANESMQSIHDRMPIILNKEQVKQFLLDQEGAQHILKIKPPALEKTLV